MTGEAGFSNEFKRYAVAQIAERGYPVAEISRRLGINPHSSQAWKKNSPPSGQGRRDETAEARTRKGHRGARYPGRATVNFARDAK